jgi:hypothetical protein
MRKAIDPAAGPAHLTDLFEAIVFSPAFKQRTFDWHPKEREARHEHTRSDPV